MTKEDCSLLSLSVKIVLSGLILAGWAGFAWFSLAYGFGAIWLYLRIKSCICFSVEPTGKNENLNVCGTFSESDPYVYTFESHDDTLHLHWDKHSCNPNCSHKHPCYIHILAPDLKTHIVAQFHNISLAYSFTPAKHGSQDDIHYDDHNGTVDDVKVMCVNHTPIEVGPLFGAEPGNLEIFTAGVLPLAPIWCMTSQLTFIIRNVDVEKNVTSLFTNYQSQFSATISLHKAVGRCFYYTETLFADQEYDTVDTISACYEGSRGPSLFNCDRVRSVFSIRQTNYSDGFGLTVHLGGIDETKGCKYMQENLPVFFRTIWLHVLWTWKFMLHNTP